MSVTSTTKEGAFWARKFGLKAHQTKGVGCPWRRGEIIHFVIQQYPGAVCDQPDAIAEIECVGVAHGIAELIDHGKMRGVGTFPFGGTTVVALDGVALVMSIARALPLPLVFRQQLRNWRIDECRITEIARAIGISALHRLDHDMQRINGARAHLVQLVPFEDVQ